MEGIVFSLLESADRLAALLQIPWMTLKLKREKINMLKSLYMI